MVYRHLRWCRGRAGRRHEHRHGNGDGQDRRPARSDRAGALALQREIAAVSKTLGLIVVGIAIVVMAAIALLNGIDDADDAVTILLLGVSLAVAAVPEGLPRSSPSSSPSASAPWRVATPS